MSNPDNKGFKTPYKQPEPCNDPFPDGAGYAVKATNGVHAEPGVKTDGIKQRGHGAAVKGFTSRGPMG